ncbi:response regulator, partial [Aeromonas salmonicida]
MGELNVATVTRLPGVLLVDSQDTVLQRLHKLLSAHDYRLYLAHDASEALQVMAREEVDLVISAAHLPQVDGAT